MKTLFVAFVLCGHALASDYLDTLVRFYPNQTRAELELRVAEGRKGGAFELWRSFSPYFYHLTFLNPSPVITSRTGLCAGDAHLENFGFLPLLSEASKKPLFTLNDLDDVTECPLDLDLLRLRIGHRLAGGTHKTDEFLSSYQSGLKGEGCELTKYIVKREKKSLEGGMNIEKLFLKAGIPFCPGPEYLTVSEDELVELKSHHADRAGSTFLGACSRTKTTGGSAGEKRFAVLFQNADSSYGVYELKPLVRPAYSIAVDPDTSSDPVAREELFLRALTVYFGPESFQHIKLVQFAGKLYQSRPRWEGMKAVKLSDLEDLEERNKVMRYEACVLGSLHAKNLGATEVTFDPQAWDEYALKLEGIFKTDFGLTTQN